MSPDAGKKSFNGHYDGNAQLKANEHFNTDPLIFSDARKDASGLELIVLKTEASIVMTASVDEAGVVVFC